MNRVRRFISLSAANRALLIRSYFLVMALRLALWLLPFRTLHRFLTGFAVPTGVAASSCGPSPDRIAWAVSVTSRYVPAANCLPQALAVYTLMKRRGHTADMRIGVTKGKGDQLEAHAWIENEGRIVIGGSDSPSRFKPLLITYNKEDYERDRGHILLG